MAADHRTPKTIINNIRWFGRYEPFYGRSETVVLPGALVDRARDHGVKMRRTSIDLALREKNPNFRSEAKKIRNHALGALPEMALRFTLGFDLKLPSEEYNVPDMPGKIQARLIGEDRFGLRVYDKDGDDWPVVGVVIERGMERKPYRIPGWFYAGDAKGHTEWLMDPHDLDEPFKAVPQIFLRPLRELRVMLARDLVC